MSVKKDDASGRRSVALEFEIPGSPESVWRAIATGPGISAWFAPSEVEERVGGAVLFRVGPGMESPGTVTTWAPPHRFAYEEQGWSGAAPPLATEFVVEAQSGGVCRVRLVHSLFTSEDDWDDQLESMESGWPAFFAVLRLYQLHFSGQRAASGGVNGGHAGAEAEAHARLTTALGLADPVVGERRTTLAGAPRLAGTIERVPGGAHHHELMVRVDEPAPGVVLLGAYTWGGEVKVAISFFFYGDDAEANLARELPIWRAWLAERFPAGEVVAAE